MHPTSRITASVCVSFILAADLSCELPPDERYVESVPPLGVYAEFLEPSEIEASLPDLSAAETSLTLALPTRDIGDDEIAALVRKARSEHVDVRLWPVLETSQGYWPNETNIELFASEVTRLLDWIEEEELHVSGVVYDMEPAYDYALEIRALNTLDRAAITELFAAHLDPVAYDDARARLTESVLEVQSRGLRAVCVTFPQVLDDLVDGDDDLQDALDIPVDGVPFDEVGFMVYQTTFAEVLGEWSGPSLVSDFATDAVATYGERAVVALGTVGTVGIVGHEFGYEDPTVLAADVEAARAAGITRIEIYSLDGMVETDDLAGWLASTPIENPIDVPALTGLVRTFIQGLDTELDG